jgi:hypothetical protein
MNRTITGHGGRAPPGQNTRTLSAESRWPVSLALKIFQPPALARREARPRARITVRLPHSLAECLGRAPQVRRDHSRTAHSSAWASPWSSIIRTARAPGPLAKDRLGRPIDPILPRHEVSQKPGTIQDPLVKKLRRQTIADVAANAFLETEYWTSHNQLFARPPASPETFTWRSHGARSFG